MKTRLSYLSFLALILGTAVVGAIAFSKHAAAQPTGASQAPSRLAVIDIKYILENHARFKASMEALKARYEAAGKQLNDERTRIVDMQKKMGQYETNTSNYNQLDEQITRAKADWSVQAEKHKKDIRNSEAHILWSVYKEISTETGRYCQQNGIGLVVQFNGEPVKGNKPQDVFQGITRPIVYNAPSLDITPWILKALNTGAPPVNPTADNRNRTNIGVRPPN